MALAACRAGDTLVVTKLFVHVLAMVAEFEADSIRLRTREGMQVAKAKGRLRRKQPKPKPNQAKHRLELHDLAPTPRRSSLGFLASADRRSTAHWSGCGLSSRAPAALRPILKPDTRQWPPTPPP
jgi:hypothetical protein